MQPFPSLSLYEQVTAGLFSPRPLYQRAALAFWSLAEYFNEVEDSRHQPGFCGATRQILPVGRLLRAIFMMIDSGKLNDNSPAWAIHPREGEDTNLRGNASLDTHEHKLYHV